MITQLHSPSKLGGLLVILGSLLFLVLQSCTATTVASITTNNKLQFIPKCIPSHGGVHLHIHLPSPVNIGLTQVLVNNQICTIKPRLSTNQLLTCTTPELSLQEHQDTTSTMIEIIDNESNTKLYGESICVNSHAKQKQHKNKHLAQLESSSLTIGNDYISMRIISNEVIKATHCFQTQVHAWIGEHPHELIIEHPHHVESHDNNNNNNERIVHFRIPRSIVAGEHIISATHNVFSSDHHEGRNNDVAHGHLLSPLTKLIVKPSIIGISQYVNKPGWFTIYGSGFDLANPGNNHVMLGSTQLCQVMDAYHHILEVNCNSNTITTTTLTEQQLPPQQSNNEQDHHHAFPLVQINTGQRYFLTHRVEFPDPRDPPQSLQDKQSISTPSDLKVEFIAPVSGTYKFRLTCGGPSNLPSSSIQGAAMFDYSTNTAVICNAQDETMLTLSESQRVPFHMHVTGLAYDESVKLYVRIYKKSEEESTDTSSAAASTIHHDGILPMPAKWFSTSEQQEQRTKPTSNNNDIVQVWVNSFRAICRTSKGTCSIQDDISIIQTQPVWTPYPETTLSQPEQQQQQPPNLNNKNFRRQLSTVYWSTYASTCTSTCVIPAGTDLILDSSMDVTSLTIRGSLTWDTTKNGLTLAAGFVVVEQDGIFNLGSLASPMQKAATIYIKNNGATHPTLGVRVFGSYFDGSTSIQPNVQVHGKVKSRTWTLLTSYIASGATVIQVAHDVATMGWAIGDRITLSPTGLPVTSAAGTNYAETFTISSFSGTSITLNTAVTQVYLGDTVNQLQAEVINLSRNILITGDAFDVNKRGLHTVCHSGGTMRITYTRIEKAGQLGITGKYPLHFHNVKSCSTCLFKGNAIEDSQQRGIIVHATHLATVEDNVLTLIRGAGLYVEDGNEIGNVFKNNVVICHGSSQDRQECKAVGTDNDQADSVQQSGGWVLSTTNDFIGNRFANQYNAFFTQTSAFPWARGLSSGKVCTRFAPFGTFSGTVSHSNWRFGFYLDNSFPRQLLRSTATDGWVTDIETCKSGGQCSCDTFKADGTDNGIFTPVSDNIDFCNNFVGQYELGDIQYLRYKSVNNLMGMYWKHTKNFVDGTSSHIKDCSFYWITNTNMPGLPAEGVAFMLGPGGLGAFVIENTSFKGAVGVAVAANQHCNVGPGTGGLCTPEYVFVSADFSGVPVGRKILQFGASDGNPELPIFTTFDTSLRGYRSVASKYSTHLLTLPGTPCRWASEVGLSVEFDGGIVCQNSKLRRLQIWSGNQGTLTLQAPGGGSYSMKYQLSPCENCAGNSESTKSGYGAVVVTDFAYTIPTLDWNFKPSNYAPPVTVEFSDTIFGTRFSNVDAITLTINGATCTGGLSSQHSRLWVSYEGPKQSNRGACRSTGPPVPPSKSPTITVTPAPTTTAPTTSTRALLWSDEFDGTTLNTAIWSLQLISNPNNNELEYYTDRVPDNSFVSGGYLTIRAKPESYGGRSFTSAKLITRNKKDFTYGRVEVRAKLPVGQGMWPAIWMMPTDSVYGGWPGSGEIDIMEHVTCDLNNIHGTIHTGAYNWPMGTQIGATTPVVSAADWHVYALEWTSLRIQMFVDDKLYMEFVNDQKNDYKTWPFNKNFYVILNVAVGGDWGGSCLGGKPPVFSVPNGDLLIDYVRVYAPLTNDATGCTAIGNDPWATGSNIPCCDWTCLKNWDGDGRYYYKCTSSQATCTNSFISSAPTGPTTSTPTNSKAPTTTTATPTSSCTLLGNDPWSTGTNIPCCTGLTTCLKDWQNNNRWYYICTSSQATCDSGMITNTPTSPLTKSPTLATSQPTTLAPTTAAQCTPIPQDPYQTGTKKDCCSGSVQCLNNWNNDGRWYYLCLSACPTQSPTPIPTTVVAETCTGQGGNPIAHNKPCCQSPVALVNCTKFWDSPAVAYPKCVAPGTCDTSSPTTTSLVNCTQWVCGYDCLLRAGEGCGWSSSSVPPGCYGGGLFVTTQDEYSAGICTQTTNSPTLPTLQPTVLANTYCANSSLCDLSACYQVGPQYPNAQRGNLQTGIGFAYYSDDCKLQGGGFACLDDISGCRSCRLQLAHMDREWLTLPICPACVCLREQLSSSLCLSETCTPTVSPTLKTISNSGKPTSSNGGNSTVPTLSNGSPTISTVAGAGTGNSVMSSEVIIGAAVGGSVGALILGIGLGILLVRKLRDAAEKRNDTRARIVMDQVVQQQREQQQLQFGGGQSPHHAVGMWERASRIPTEFMNKIYGVGGNNRHEVPPPGLGPPGMMVNRNNNNNNHVPPLLYPPVGNHGNNHNRGIGGGGIITAMPVMGGSGVTPPGFNNNKNNNKTNKAYVPLPDI
jgi:beta-glucanase (GH16 family)